MVEPHEAARLAAVNYVTATAFHQGREDGWRAGWRDAFAYFCGPNRVLATDAPGQAPATDTPGQAPSVPLTGSARGPENVIEERFELSEEWAAFFARSNNAKAVPDDGAQEVEDEDATLDLGGGDRVAREEQATALYGEHASAILHLDAAMEAQLISATQGRDAVVWPAVGIAELHQK